MELRKYLNDPEIVEEEESSSSSNSSSNGHEDTDIESYDIEDTKALKSKLEIHNICTKGNY